MILFIPIQVCRLGWLIIVQALQLNPVPGTKVAQAPWPAQQSPIAPAVKLRQVASLATHGIVVVEVVVVTVVVVVAAPAVQMLSIQKPPSLQKPRLSSGLQSSPISRIFWQK